jgi:hypothetical protein
MGQLVQREGVDKRAVDALRDVDRKQLADGARLLLLIAAVVAVQAKRHDGLEVAVAADDNHLVLVTPHKLGDRRHPSPPRRVVGLAAGQRGLGVRPAPGHRCAVVVDRLAA